MKKIFFAISFSCALTTLSLHSLAQANNKTKTSRTPKWVSENGYWNIETNIHTPKLSTIYFYNNDNQLLYKEKVEGMVIKYKKRSVKLNLKKALDQAVLAYSQKEQTVEDGLLVQNLIRR